VWPAVIALIPVVLAAAYMLRVYQGMMHGPAVADLPERPDLTWVEGIALAPLVIAFVLLGVQPLPVANGLSFVAAQMRAAQGPAPSSSPTPQVTWVTIPGSMGGWVLKQVVYPTQAPQK